MRSTTRFLEGTLLGVALGVALGFLFFQKNARKDWKDLWSPSSQPVSPQGATVSPSFGGEVAETVPWTAEASEYDFAAAGLATEAEVFAAPELLEEPLPGAGWEPSATPGEEEALEEMMPPMPAEMEPYASVEVEPLDAEGIPVWAEIPALEPEVEPDVEAAAIEGLESGEPAVEEPPVEEPAAEEPEAELVEIEAAPIVTLADDLKARIEETRRRIRRELEQPFIVGSGVAGAEAAATSGFEPVIGEALAVEPSAEEGPGSEIQGSTASTVGDSDFPSVVEAEEYPPAGAEGLGVDYEAMRGRIEETRSRLKAKAFDAMMTGESALLGRDPEDAGVKLPAPTEVDGEIVQTIDETLREEES